MRRSLFTVLLVGIGFASFTGCDWSTVTINPFLDGEQYFSVFGYLDTAADTHFVRVTALRTSLSSENETIDASVTTTDLGTGQIVHWRDSLITLADSRLVHVFYALMDVIPGHTYRLEVVRSDGATTWSDTSVPSLPNPKIGPAADFGTANYIQEVYWEGITEKPHIVEVWYRFLDSPRNRFREFGVDYETEHSNRGDATDQGWRVRVQLTKDRNLLRKEYPTFLVSMYNVGMRVLMRDQEWMPPEGVFDPDVLSQPEVMTNVENGFGFFGSLGQFDVEWVLPDDVLGSLGYIPPIAQPGN